MARRFKSVGVLKGGISSEREVSLRSGSAVADGLRREGYRVSEIDVTCRELRLPGGIEAVFIALHGEFGEDGCVQEILERMGLPYTGSGPAASRMAFDKRLAKRVFEKEGVPTPEYRVMARGGVSRPDLPVVVKPACGGSSIGVHRVFREDEWPAAVEDAFRHGDEIVVEKYIEGRELTVGIVGEDVLPVIEIVAPSGWYDYGAKYTAGATRYLAPAPLESAPAAECSLQAWRAFRALGCRGMGRADIRLSAEGTPYVLEMNSIPGFTETSLLPKAAKAVGIGFSVLCDRIMNTAALDGRKPGCKPGPDT